MTEYRETLDRIKNYEQQTSFAKMTNERELPKLIDNLNRITSLEFHKADKDLLTKLTMLREEVITLESDNFSRELLERLKGDINSIGEELVRRYKERMDSYATRQGNF